MSQLSDYKTFIDYNGGRLTLKRIMQTKFGVEYRKNNSLLRDEGWTVECLQNRDQPGRNLYVFNEPRRKV